MYCNRCGARLEQGTVICPECGARQRRPTRSIRCARCRGRASVEMTVCPHCGRTLVPAGPRWALWIPLALLVAFAAYWGRDKLPVEQIMQRVEAAQAGLSGMVQLPEFVAPTATPTAALAAAQPTRATRTSTPTPTATTTSTRPPSATPSPTATPTAAGGAREYIVQSGDSLALIGDKLDLPWRVIAAINGLTEFSILRPGDKLRLPTLTPAPTSRLATPTAAPTASATPTRLPALTATSVSASLTVAPAATAAPATVAAAPSATPTRPPAPTATATPTATPAPVLAAPLLVIPGDQNAYSGDTAQVVLEWQSRDGLPRGAVYRLTIAWVEKGNPISWSWDTATTSLRAASWLWQRADQPARQYTWSVQIVQVTTDGKGGERIVPLSPPSEKRVFYWY